LGVKLEVDEAAAGCAHAALLRRHQMSLTIPGGDRLSHAHGERFYTVEAWQRLPVEPAGLFVSRWPRSAKGRDWLNGQPLPATLFANGAATQAPPVPRGGGNIATLIVTSRRPAALGAQDAAKT
jgi:hypothetical protein